MIQPDQLEVLIMCYGLLFLLCFWVWKMKSENLVSEEVLSMNWILLHIRHAGGIIIMTVIPVTCLPVVTQEIFLWPNSIDIIQGLTLIATGWLLVSLALKNDIGISQEKQAALKGSSIHVMLHILLRSTFLVSYEWFFRGCILFTCVHLFGAVAAVIINLALYAFIHSFNGKKEMYGSVPFGLILCIFSLWYQSVWPAILLHLLLSSFHEYFILLPLLNKSSKTVL